MTATKVVVAVVLVGGLGVGAWRLNQWRKLPPEIGFAKATRETITSSVSTNGKAEPVEWALARTERSGAAVKILVARGQHVMRGQTLLELDATDAQSELAAAEARISAARAELDVLSKGGRATELAEIASALDRAKLDLRNAEREFDTLVKLQAKQAATRFEVDSARRPVENAQLQIQSLERRRAALVAPSDKSAAEARLRDGEAAAELARSRIHMSVVRAPIEGTVYQFDLKPGAYLNTGDVVAAIGRLERIHVNVFVDEPDLGRVDRGMPVTITWDALPGRVWKGVVESTPTQIVPNGARQVGEVICTIQNPELDLLPGTNVTAEIRSEMAKNAVIIPKETIRREGGKDGVYILEGDHIKWRTIKIGVANTTRAQVKEPEDLKEGDALALPTERQLKDGMMVRPVFPQ